MTVASQKEVSEHLAMSIQTLNNRLKKGILPSRVGTGGLDLDACRVAELKYWRGRAAGTISDENTYNQQEERGRLVFHQANLASLQEQVLRGELLKADVVVRSWENKITAARAKLLAMPMKIAAEFGGDNSTEMMLGIERVVYNLLEELAAYELPEDSESGDESVAPADEDDSEPVGRQQKKAVSRK